MQGWIPPVLALVVLAGVVWIATRWFEWSRLYRPHRRMARTPAAVGLSFESVSFVAEDAAVLHGWWIPAPDAPGTVLYCHGNGDTIGDLVDVAADLHAMGMNVFLWDYRGYGNSRGLPTEKGTYRDARAAYEVVRARHGGGEAPPVVVIGRSLGGAVAVQLARDKPVRGLVLESTFTSTIEVGRYGYPNLPISWMVRYRYDSLQKIGAVTAPVLVAHSPQDETIPFEQGRRLFLAAQSSKRWVELRGSHAEAGWRTRPEYGDALRALIRQLFGPEPDDVRRPGPPA